jgi:hypothetical protein
MNQICGNIMIVSEPKPQGKKNCQKASGK